MNTLLVSISLAALLAVGPVHAQDDDDWGESDDTSGFDDVVVPDVKEAPPEAKPLTFGGTLQTEEAIWLNARTPDTGRLAKARQTTDLWIRYKAGAFRTYVSGHGEYDFAIDPDVWDVATVEDYQSQLLLREAWASGTFGAVEATLGRQTVAWGEGRLLSVLDLVNPRDLREPGMVDLEDLRLPVTMARVTVSVDGGDFWPGSHRFEAMAVPEAHFGYRSPPMGPFGMFNALMGDMDVDEQVANMVNLDEAMDSLQIDYAHLQERWATDQIQAYGRWTWRGRGLDLGLYGATLLDQQGVIQMPELEDLVTNANLGEPVSIEVDHQRYRMLGTSGVAQVWELLVRWEVAHKAGVPVNVGEVIKMESQGLFGDVPVIDVRPDTTDMAQALVGLSWSGWNGTMVDIDVLDGWLLDPPEDVIFPLDASGFAVRGSKSFLKERLELDLAVMGWGWRAEHGALGRAGVSYEIRDGVHANVGAITYRPGEERGPLLGLEQHDRAFGGLRWDF